MTEDQERSPYDHKTCEIFAEYCRNRGIPLQCIPESQVPNERSPDFKLQLGDEEIVVEIKAIEPNDDDLRNSETLEENGGVEIFHNPGRISAKLKNANSQLRPHSERGIPGVVCIFDESRSGLLRNPVAIHSAMFGKPAFTFLRSQEPAPACSAPAVQLISGRSKTLTEQHKTSISAVLIFIDHDPDQYEAILLHNPFARCPIPPDCAKHFVDHQLCWGPH